MGALAQQLLAQEAASRGRGPQPPAARPDRCIFRIHGSAQWRAESCHQRIQLWACAAAAVPQRFCVLQSSQAGATVQAPGDPPAEAAVCNRCPHRQADPAPPLPGRPTWAVGVTTAPRTQPTLEHTLAHLVAAGWDDWTLFAEPDAPIPAAADGQRVQVNPQRLGPWPNWLQALRRLAAAKTDLVLLLQDDVQLAAGVRAFLERHAWPRGAAWLSLWTHRKYRRGTGWHATPIDGDGLQGALAWVFPRDTLRQIIDDETLLARRDVNHIDTALGQWSQRSGWQVFCCSPSLAEHTGHTSTIWDKWRDQPTTAAQGRVSGDWLGNYQDEPNALAYPWLPAVCAVMVTGKYAARVPLAHRAVEAFQKQTYPADRRRLLIVNDGAASVLKGYDGPAERVDEVRTDPAPLGALRNVAWDHCADADALMQWDDDDYYHPDRIAAQLSVWRPGQANVLARQVRADLTAGEAFVQDLRGGIDGTICHDARTPHRYDPQLRRGEDTVFRAQWPATAQTVIDNDPTLYIRFYNEGLSTWDRDHVLLSAEQRAARPLSDAAAAYLRQVRLAYPLPLTIRWRLLDADLAGWWPAALTDAVHALTAAQPTGHVVELGVYRGRSLAALATTLRTSERALGIDGFDAAVVSLSNAVGDQAAAEAALVACQVADRAACWRADTQQLTAEAVRERLPGSIRLVHVDAGHAFTETRHDLDLAAALLAPYGALLVDDVFSQDWPDVSRAWHAWLAAHNAWCPFALIGNRLMVARDAQHADRYAAALEDPRHYVLTYAGRRLLRWA